MTDEKEDGRSVSEKNSINSWLDPIEQIKVVITAKTI